MNRAYSLLEIKSIDAERRVITGIATTPTPDRGGDIIEPLGVRFKNPLPLLLHHDTKQPVGQVRFDKPTKAGITFTATIPTITEPGTLKDRTDEAFHSVKYGVLTGASVGFKEVEGAIKRLASGGWHFLESLVLELSLVTIPQNAEATILTVKSLDLGAPAPDTPRVVGPSTVVRLQKAPPPMTIQEQITQFENTRAAKAARMLDIMTKAGETNSTLDAQQTEDYDTLSGEVKSIDEHLIRLHDQERLMVVKATPITSTTSTVTASALRGGTPTTPIITVKANLPKGTAFTRYAMAIAAGKGDYMSTMEHAKKWNDSTPEVELMVKAAVAAGTTTDATWAGPLVVTQPTAEFLELLRPRTLLGQIPGLRHVPFNVSVPSQTAGGTYSWVGQGLAKPVTNATFATVTVPFAKAAGIIVLTEELVRLSTPSAEALIREEMIAGMAKFLDEQFNDPTVAVSANVSPASITNGASTAAASGATSAAARADLAASVAVFTAANIPLAGSVWLMNDSNAFGLSMSVNALGQPLFPGMSAQGGTIFGMPVVVSNNVSTRVILVHAPSILVADEGGVKIDVSREASIQMDGAPTNPSDATTVLVSLWQRNMVGLRAERMITWIRARTAAVRYISAAAYVGS